jgi:pantoate--beta-alanine ligase
MKDYQQLRIIETMVRDLNFDLDIVRCPIVREPDGVAMSSRNSYLSEEERRAAAILRISLIHAEESFRAGERDPEKLKSQVRAEIKAEPLAQPDYIELVDANELQPTYTIERDSVLAVAVRFGKARLIDNLYLQFLTTGDRVA